MMPWSHNLIGQRGKTSKWNFKPEHTGCFEYPGLLSHADRKRGGGDSSSQSPHTTVTTVSLAPFIQAPTTVPTPYFQVLDQVNDAGRTGGIKARGLPIGP